MLRKRFQLLSIAFLSLALSHVAAAPSFADGAPAFTPREPATSLLSGQKLASADIGSGLSPASTTILTATPADQSTTPPAGRLIDYPALVLLAIAIICMAALSRREIEGGLKEGNG